MGEAPHPNNVRAEIPESVLRQLYVDRRMTLAQVAQPFGMASTTIRRRLRDLGIAARPRGPAPAYVGDPRFGLGAASPWTTDVAYIVGLIATDGCLSGNGRTVSITSKDAHILQSVRAVFGGGAIGVVSNAHGKSYCRYQFSNRGLYAWLVDIGLMPAKSLRLGPLAVPELRRPLQHH